jgi:hypothetical protein
MSSRHQLVKGRDGSWSLTIGNETTEEEKSHSSYPEALPRYVTSFDLAFSKAKERSEFALISTLLRVRGLQDAGWDPYETSLAAIGQMRAVHQKIESFYAARYLTIDPELELKEAWDRDLRNAIFHSDYSVHGPEVRFKKDGYPHAYGHEEILTLVNRALAYFDALEFLHAHYIGSYAEPKEIAMHPLNAGPPNERAVVMVREGHGAIGLKHAWTLEELKRGHINWRFGRFSMEEMKLADADSTRASFPARVPSSGDPET